MRRTDPCRRHRFGAARAASIFPGLLLLVCLAVGCAYQRVGYDLKGVPDLSSGPLSSLRLGVEIPDDARDPELVAIRGGVIEAPTIERAGETWYVNGDDGYKDGPVTTAIARAIVQHLSAANLFASVALAAEDPGTDLVLRGSVGRFDSFRKKRLFAEAMASQPSLLGLAVGAASKTPYEANTVLELQLETRNGKVLWAGVAQGSVDGEDGVASGGLEVYETANLALRRAVEQLLAELGRVRLPSAKTASSEPEWPESLAAQR